MDTRYRAPAMVRVRVSGMRRCRSGPPRPISTQEQGRDRALPDCGGRGELAYGLGLRALGARNDVKLDPVAFIQGMKASAFKAGVMDEGIHPRVLRNEPVAFDGVKPLHGPLCHEMILLTWGESMPQRRIGGP